MHAERPSACLLGAHPVHRAAHAASALAADAHLLHRPSGTPSPVPRSQRSQQPSDQGLHKVRSALLKQPLTAAASAAAATAACSCCSLNNVLCHPAGHCNPHLACACTILQPLQSITNLCPSSGGHGTCAPAAACARRRRLLRQCLQTRSSRASSRGRTCSRQQRSSGWTVRQAASSSSSRRSGRSRPARS